MKIRPACEADSARIASLLGELGYPASEEQIRDRLRSAQPLPTINLVAEADGEVVACLSACLVPYFPDGSTLCRITAIVVTSDRRGSGAGRALVEAAAEYAGQHGCSGLEATSADRRLDAHRFYERLGFSRTGARFVRPL